MTTQLCDTTSGHFIFEIWLKSLIVGPKSNTGTVFFGSIFGTDTTSDH